MLADKNITAFIASTRLEKAKAFYRDLLGLALISEDKFALEFTGKNCHLRVSLVEQLIPQQFTVLGWSTDDITDTVTKLIKKGISMEKYSYFEQNSLGIWQAPSGAKVAWFKDPDGNLLSITE